MLINIAALLAYAIAISIGNLLFQTRRQSSCKPSRSGVASCSPSASRRFYLAALPLSDGDGAVVWILVARHAQSGLSFSRLAIHHRPALASYFFGDVQTARYWLGAALVAVGVVVTQV